MKKYFPLFFLTLFVPSIVLGSFDTSLKYGARGQAVIELQDLLINEDCLNTTSSGYFGLLTLKAVKCFQTKYSLPSTGYFGVMSRAKADEIVAGITALSNNAALAEIATSSAVVPNQADTIKPKTFTLPNGTIVDAQWNIISTISPSPLPVNIPQTITQFNFGTLSVTVNRVVTTQTSVHMEWNTTIPSESKVFLIKDGSTQVVQSLSGRSTHHIVDASSLLPNTQYSYIIEAIADSKVERKNGAFITQAVPPQIFTSSSIKNPINPNDTVPFLKFTSDKPFTIKKLVFANDDSYCAGSMYQNRTLNLTYEKDQNSSIAIANTSKDSFGRFTIEALQNVPVSGGTVIFRLSNGQGERSGLCIINGFSITLIGSESVVVGADGNRIDLKDTVLTYQGISPVPAVDPYAVITQTSTNVNQNASWATFATLVISNKDAGDILRPKKLLYRVEGDLSAGDFRLLVTGTGLASYGGGLGETGGFIFNEGSIPDHPKENLYTIKIDGANRLGKAKITFYSFTAVGQNSGEYFKDLIQTPVTLEINVQ